MRKAFERALGEKPPAGMVYQWNPIYVHGIYVGDDVMAEYREAGWVDVPAERFAEIPVEAFGMRLMERPSAASVEFGDRVVEKDRYQRSKEKFKSVAEFHAPRGFSVVMDPEDLPYTATETGWMPTETIRQLEDEEEQAQWVKLNEKPQP